MILTTELLEQVRKRKKYRKGMLAEHLNVTLPELNKLIARGYILQYTTLVQWANFLEQPDDLEPLRQYNMICENYIKLRQHLGIEQVLAETLAQVVVFREQIDLNRLRSQILEQTIHCLHRQSYDVSNALMDLKAK